MNPIPQDKQIALIDRLTQACTATTPGRPGASIHHRPAMLAFISSGLLTHPEIVGLNPEYLHELMWGGAVRAVLARALVCGKLFHFDINDGYRSVVPSSRKQPTRSKPEAKARMLRTSAQ